MASSSVNLKNYAATPIVPGQRSLDPNVVKAYEQARSKYFNAIIEAAQQHMDKVAQMHASASTGSHPLARFTNTAVMQGSMEEGNLLSTSARGEETDTKREAQDAQPIGSSPTTANIAPRPPESTLRTATVVDGNTTTTPIVNRSHFGPTITASPSGVTTGKMTSPRQSTVKRTCPLRPKTGVMLPPVPQQQQQQSSSSPQDDGGGGRRGSQTESVSLTPQEAHLHPHQQHYYHQHSHSLQTVTPTTCHGKRPPTGGSSKRSGGGGGGSRSGEPYPTSLPFDLLELNRHLRDAVDAVAAVDTVPESIVNELTLRSAALSRYVSSFISTREQERAAEEESRVRGWLSLAAARSIQQGANNKPSATGAAEGTPQTIEAPWKRVPGSSSAAPNTNSHHQLTRKHTQDHDDDDEADQTHRSEASSSSDSDEKRLRESIETISQYTLSSLYIVMDALLHQTHCDRGAIFLLDPQNLELVSCVLVGAVTLVRPIRISRDHGVAGAVYRTGIAMSVANTDRVPSAVFSHEVDNKTGYYTRNILCFPLRKVWADNGGGLKRDEVFGVVQLVNKLRPTATGFSPTDEAMLYHASLLIEGLFSAAGDSASFVGSIAQEASLKMQATLLSVRHETHLNRQRAQTTTSAGSASLTLTAATAMHQQQKAQEQKLFALSDPNLGNDKKKDVAAHQRGASAARGKGMPKPPPLPGSSGPTKLSHPLVNAIAGHSLQGTALIYRVGDSSNSMDMGNNPTTANPTSRQGQVSKEGGKMALKVDLDALDEVKDSGEPNEESLGSKGTMPSVRDVAAFLQRLQDSWKLAREQCIKLERIVEQLRVEKAHETSKWTRLNRLCLQAGIIPDESNRKDDSDTPVLRFRQYDIGVGSDQAGFDAEEDGKMDDVTFLSRLAEREDQLVRSFVQQQQQEATLAQLRASAAAAPVQQRRREREASLAAQQLSALCHLDIVANAKNFATRDPLVRETERQTRERQLHIKRREVVQSRLQALKKSHEKEHHQLARKQQRETEALFKVLLEEDEIVAASLKDVVLDTLDPKRHQFVEELFSKFCVL